MPPPVFLATLVLMLALDALLPLGRPVTGLWRWVGLAPVVGGLWLNRAAHDLFRRHGTPTDPRGKPATLVVRGPFRYTRNPMYLGGLLILLGLAVLLGSATPFALVPAFAGSATVLFIRPEETSLARRFGSDYESYCRKVRRWI